jgi:hypothetical protein
MPAVRTASWRTGVRSAMARPSDVTPFGGPLSLVPSTPATAASRFASKGRGPGRRHCAGTSEVFLAPPLGPAAVAELASEFEEGAEQGDAILVDKSTRPASCTRPPSLMNWRHGRGVPAPSHGYRCERNHDPRRCARGVHASDGAVDRHGKTLQAGAESYTRHDRPAAADGDLGRHCSPTWPPTSTVRQGRQCGSGDARPGRRIRWCRAWLAGPDRHRSLGKNRDLARIVRLPRVWLGRRIGRGIGDRRKWHQRAPRDAVLPAARRSAAAASFSSRAATAPSA